MECTQNRSENMSEKVTTEKIKTEKVESLPEGWKRVRLGDKTYFRIVGSGIEYFSGVKYYLSTNSVQETKITHIEDIITFKSRPSRANIQPKKGRVAFARMRNTIKVLLIDEKLEKDYILSTGFALIETIIDPKFLYQFVLSSYFNKQKDIFAEGTTQEAISNDDFNRIFIAFPEKESEQRKIAEILETVDNAIEKTDAIIEKYRRIKKGLMADLLTGKIRLIPHNHSEAEGEESPLLTSPEAKKFVIGDKTFVAVPNQKWKNSPIGKIPEEWEVKKLGEAFNIKAGGDISKLLYSDTKDEKFKYPIFSNTLENKGLYGYSDKFTYPENCITITGRGTLGYAIPRFEKFNAIIRVLVLIPKLNVNITFISEYINNSIYFVIESTGVPQLTAPKVAEYYVPLPPLSEQQLIADLLSQVDEVIEKEIQYKEKLERIKKGLMEDLLTGKVRVNNLIKEDIQNDTKVL
jgi:type I restriction enzyme S subunit